MTISTLRVDATAANRYLADQLTESERAAYESALVQDPAVLLELEATARLKLGLHQLRNSEALDDLVRERRFFQPQLAAALAAAIAVVAIGIGLWHPSMHIARPQLLAAALSALTDQNGAALSLADTEAVFRKRGESYDTVLKLPPVRAAIQLRMYPLTPDKAGRYEATLVRIGEAASDTPPIAVLRDLRPMQDGFIDLFADSSGLTAGVYRLTLTGESTPGASVDTFLIKVAAPSSE